MIKIKNVLTITAVAAGLMLGCGGGAEQTNTPEGDNTPSGDDSNGRNVASQAASDALHKAAERGDLETMKKLIAEKADINSQAGKDGETPLLRAITRGQTEAAKLLIDSGADVNLGRKRDGRTPLAMAESRERTEIVAMLKAKGAK